MAGNHVLLETIELTQTVGDVTFDNIPQTGYTDLKIVVSARSSRAANQDDYVISFNGSAYDLSYRQLYGGAGSGSIVTGSATGSTGFVGIIPATNNTTNTFGAQEIYIPNYTASVAKSYSVNSASENNASTQWQLDLIAGQWSNTGAITSIKLTATNGSFVAKSTFSLYGVAATGTTPTVAPKATGGNIVANDGTYWYHAFLTSGTFTPQTALTCNALVVAGGGGAGSDAAGGGGAGGVLSLTSQSLTTTNYTVIVGAGGVGYSNGSDSQIGALTAAVGGGKGASYATSPGNGGSGGGAYGGSYSVGTGTSGQGNNGGTGAGSAGGGGGGAGTAGSNGTSAPRGGDGGVGTSSFSSWGAVTLTGQNVSGTYYYAGGGGGAGRTNPGNSGNVGVGGYGGGGNGGSYTQIYPTNGLANTGGGAGGADFTTSANGGSGVVIIRYAMV
jgi:hypothetical protein